MNGHQELIKKLIKVGDYLNGQGLPRDADVAWEAADALHAVDAGLVCALPAPPTERTITINDTVIEAVAKKIASSSGNVWEELSRDRKRGYRWVAMSSLDAAYAAQNPEGDPK